MQNQCVAISILVYHFFVLVGKKQIKQYAKSWLSREILVFRNKTGNYNFSFAFFGKEVQQSRVDLHCYRGKTPTIALLATSGEPTRRRNNDLEDCGS